MNKKFYLFGFITFVIATLFFSCDKDNLFHHSHDHSLDDKSNISFNDFLAKTKIKNFKSKITFESNQNEFHARQTNNFSSFIIDTTIVKQLIKDNGISTFTLPVIPIPFSNNENFYYNIVFYKINSEFQWSILEFEKNTDESISVTEILNETNNNNLVNFGNQLSARIYTVWTTGPIFHCTKTGPCADGPCDGCNLCVSIGTKMGSIEIPDREFPSIQKSPNELMSQSVGGGGSTISASINLAINNFKSTLNPTQLAIYNSNKADFDNYLKNNSISFPNELGAHVTNLNSDAEEFINDLLNFLSNRDSDTINNIINYLNINNYTLESITFINNLKDEIINNENNINSLNINSILELSTPLNRINDINDYLKCFNLSQPATFTIYVDQPTTNSNDAWSGNALDPNVGHTFISIKQGGTRRVLGYYPSTAVGLSDPSSPGSFENDGAHEFDVAISININTSQLTNLINYIKTKASSTYNLNTFNCSDFGMGASSIAGMPLGSAYGSWGFGGGDNPGQLGQNIRKMPTPTGAVKTTTTGNAASNIGTCN